MSQSGSIRPALRCSATVCPAIYSFKMRSCGTSAASSRSADPCVIFLVLHTAFYLFSRLPVSYIPLRADDLLKRQYRAALAFVIRKQLRQLLFVVAGDAVRQHMDGAAAFHHIEAGGFDAGCGIRADNIKVGNAVSGRIYRQCFNRFASAWRCGAVRTTGRRRPGAAV